MLTGNRKSIAIGAMLFVAGQLISGVLVARSGDSSGGDFLSNGAWLFVQFSIYFVAVLAGAVAARLAVDKPISIGVLAALLGAAVLLVPAVAIGRQGIALAIIALIMFAFFSWLGAIVGAYTRVKGGT